nr:PBSX family phage terminase large subunit [Dyella mobilis]
MQIETPRVFAPLLEPSRYKGAHGGRGSGKSHFFAEMLVEHCMMQTTRAVCIREVQVSLKQSVKRLIEDKIEQLGVGGYFDVLDTEIRGPDGGLIIFQGMQSHTAESIKSLEGYDIAWCEEAQSLSQLSLRLLRPTIRKPGSELWFTWNPDSETDPVDTLLRGDKRVPGAIVVEANWADNPWFPDELEQERLVDLGRDPDGYDHVWEGGYQTISEAVIFRNRVSVEAFGEPPEKTRIFFGADWGFANDPTALIRFWIIDECLYISHEAFGHGVEIDETPELFDSIPGARNWPIKADCARPETISYMRRQGFQIDAAEKWQGSVEDGIAHMKAFKRIVVHERCGNIAKEFRLYSYKVDKKTGDVLPIIVDKFNHGIDAVRYGLDGYIQRRGGLGVWAKLAR